MIYFEAQQSTSTKAAVKALLESFDRRPIVEQHLRLVWPFRAFRVGFGVLVWLMDFGLDGGKLLPAK